MIDPPALRKRPYEILRSHYAWRKSTSGISAAAVLSVILLLGMLAILSSDGGWIRFALPPILVFALLALIARLVGRRYFLIFSAALIVRLVASLIWTLFPPVSAVEGGPAVVVDDEYYYMRISTQYAADPGLASGTSLNSARFLIPGVIFGTAMRVMGSTEPAIARIVNSIVGSVGVTLLAGAIDLLIRRRVGRGSWQDLFAVGLILNPGHLWFSTAVLKESFLFAGASLGVLGTALLDRRRMPAAGIAVAIAGTVIVGSLRPFALPFIFVPLAIVIVVRTLQRKSASGATKSATAVVIVSSALFMIVISAVTGAALLASITGESGVDKSIGSLANEIALSLSRSKLNVLGIELPPLLAALAAPLALAVQPPFTAIGGFVPWIGQPDYHVVWTSSLALGWWIPLPFLLAGGYLLIRRQVPLIVFVFGSSYCGWYLISSFTRGFATSESARGRDGFMALGLFLSAIGLQYAVEKLGRNTVLKYVAAYSAIMVLLAVVWHVIR